MIELGDLLLATWLNIDPVLDPEPILDICPQTVSDEYQQIHRPVAFPRLSVRMDVIIRIITAEIYSFDTNSARVSKMLKMLPRLLSHVQSMLYSTVHAGQIAIHEPVMLQEDLAALDYLLKSVALETEDSCEALCTAKTFYWSCVYLHDALVYRRPFDDTSDTVTRKNLVQSMDDMGDFKRRGLPYCFTFV